MTIMLLVAGTAARAFDFSATCPSGQTLRYTITGSTVSLAGLESGSGAIVVPQSVEHNGVTYAVTSVAMRAFFYKSSLTAVVLPEGMTSIESMAFYGCSALDSIVLPSSLRNIGTVAFGETAYFYDPTRWSDGLLMVGDYLVAIAATQVDSLLTLPDGLVGVGNDALNGCSRVQRVTLPATTAFLGDRAFYNCTNLDTVELLGTSAPLLVNSPFEDEEEQVHFLVPCGSLAAYQANGWATLDVSEHCTGNDPGDDPNEGIDIAAADGLKLTTSQGTLTVSGTRGHRLTVYAADGHRVATAAGDSRLTLPSRGVYIVVVESIGTWKVVSL